VDGRPSPAMTDDHYLLTRREASDRYGISVRGLETLYARYADFPVLRFGRKVLIHRDRADQWFTDFIGLEIDMEKECRPRARRTAQRR